MWIVEELIVEEEQLKLDGGDCEYHEDDRIGCRRTITGRGFSRGFQPLLPRENAHDGAASSNASTVSNVDSSRVLVLRGESELKLFSQDSSFH